MRPIYIVLLALFSCCFSTFLSADATITGVVTSQSSSLPISDATIDLIKGTQNIVATTTTAVDGSYTFTGVKPGQYTVRATATGFDTQSIGIKAPNNQTSVVDFQLLSNPGTITGQVIDSRTLLPISGASLVATQDNILFFRATTDVNGNYTLTGLDVGSYIVAALASGYQNSLEGANVQAGQTTVLDFSLDLNPGSISGTVRASNTGLPIEGAIVEAIFDDQVVESVLTDASGNYSIPGLAPDTYEVFVQADDFQVKETVVVVQADQNTIANFSLDPIGPNPGILSGTVTDADTSMPIAGAAILVFSNNMLIEEVLTDPSGNYSIDDLPPGSYKVVAHSPHHQMQILPATIQANQTTTVNFSLESNPSTIQGQITNALTGQPIPGAFELLFQDGSFEEVSFSDDHGNYIMDTLAPGNYSLTVGARGFYSKIITFSIGTGETITLNASLIPNSPPRNLNGRVINDRFPFEVDRIHHLQWDASQDPTVLYYQIFRNGALIATVSANGPLEYNDHDRSAKIPDHYLVNGVDASGNVSSSVSIILK